MFPKPRTKAEVFLLCSSLQTCGEGRERLLMLGQLGVSGRVEEPALGSFAPVRCSPIANYAYVVHRRHRATKSLSGGDGQ